MDNSQKLENTQKDKEKEEQEAENKFNLDITSSQPIQKEEENNNYSQFDNFINDLQSNNNNNSSSNNLKNNSSANRQAFNLTPFQSLMNYKSNKSQIDDNFQLKNHVSVNNQTGKIELSNPMPGFDFQSTASRMNFNYGSTEFGKQFSGNQLQQQQSQFNQLQSLTSAQNFNQQQEFKNFFNYSSTNQENPLQKQDSFTFYGPIQQSTPIQNVNNIDISINNDKNKENCNNEENKEKDIMHISPPPNLLQQQQQRKNSQQQISDSLIQQIERQKLDENSQQMTTNMTYSINPNLMSNSVNQLAKQFENQNVNNIEPQLYKDNNAYTNNNSQYQDQGISNLGFMNQPSNVSYFQNPSWGMQNKTEQFNSEQSEEFESKDFRNANNQNQNVKMNEDDLEAHETPLSKDKTSTQQSHLQQQNQNQQFQTKQENSESQNQNSVPQQKQKRKYEKKGSKLNSSSKKIQKTQKNQKNLKPINENEELPQKKMKYNQNYDDDNLSQGTYTRINTVLKTEIKTRNKDPKKKYRQSRHKNVFKNFGSAIMRFIMFNPSFMHYKLEIFENNTKKVSNFDNWLKNYVKLERKTDFVLGWTWYMSDSDEVCEFKDALRMLCYEFFENYALNYLMNSKKLDDLEIHLKSIFPFIQGINDPDTLERFKPK